MTDKDKNTGDELNPATGAGLADAPVAEEKTKSIEVPEADFKGLLKMVGDLTEKVKSQGVENETLRSMISGIADTSKPTLKKVMDRFVFLRVVGGKPVKGYVNKAELPGKKKYVYTMPHPQFADEVVEYIDLEILGEEKPVKMKYLDYIQNTERIKCRIAGVKEEEIIENQGEVEKQSFDESHGYRMNRTGIFVPAEVITKVRTFTLELPDKTEVEIGEDFINA